MSRYDYLRSQEIAAGDYPFYAILMAAMRQADDMNEYRLKKEWSRTWNELQQRYNAPGGFLEGEAHD